MAGLVFALLVAAGGALVAQNLLMTQITQASPTILITLVVNSAVGLTHNCGGKYLRRDRGCR
ncbi:hypothetical protein WBP07_22900 (plasmid) [Novosphingobium sp. BL-8A]|uniref:hypothetical protein n=1 Tax=Novosphingobium sp. BL-8A TaxID=3127639 RepID=UPI0037569BF0